MSKREARRGPYTAKLHDDLIAYTRSCFGDDVVNAAMARGKSIANAETLETIKALGVAEKTSLGGSVIARRNNDSSVTFYLRRKVKTKSVDITLERFHAVTMDTLREVDRRACATRLGRQPDVQPFAVVPDRVYYYPNAVLDAA